MESRILSHDELIEKIRKQNPLLIQAIDEVDESLLAEFQKLSIAQRIERASDTAHVLTNMIHK